MKFDEAGYRYAVRHGVTYVVVCETTGEIVYFVAGKHASTVLDARLKAVAKRFKALHPNRSYVYMLLSEYAAMSEIGQ